LRVRWRRKHELANYAIRVEDAFFFFQAEDGIRDFHVTGVQTCALPIYGSDSIRFFSCSSKPRSLSPSSLIASVSRSALTAFGLRALAPTNARSRAKSNACF